MARGIYEARNFEQIQPKMVRNKKIFNLHLPHKMYLNYILLKVFFCQRNVVGDDFQSNSKSIHLFILVFLCILVG